MKDSRSIAETIFIGARDLVDARARATYLEKECGDDRALRENVERMLQSEQKADQFFDNNPLELDDVPGVPADGLGKEGSVIGPYKLLQQIGEGGCGMVYMAEQEKPIRRRVALKLIKPGMDTKHVIARFEAERQALAMMDHPNIARVLDAGATDAGHPYFVMELVRGIKVTEYCDQNNLSTRDRLDLFTKVVQAVQHAHQKGIIHRDLKPSNVLVTLHDGVPIPKVIDFGIAKAIEQKLTDKTLFTQFEQFIGTPAYTSPEQAEMSGLDVDTRSDIYSLGVLLYELLIGMTPFDSKELLRSGVNEMRRIIREKEPDRPSTRLSTMLAEERTATAQHRGAWSPDLIHLLKGDLDWIVMKCLEKDRTRRYETASGLAADIQNYLGNEPVTARPPSASYRLGKMVRRNKPAVAAGTAVAMALVIGIIVSAWQARRAHRAELSAKAEKESTESVLNFFRDKVLAAGRPEGMDGGLGRDVTLRKAIDSAESQIAEAFKDRPLVEAPIRFTIGDTYTFLDDMPLAVKQLERALALYRQGLGPEHPATLGAMQLLSFAYGNVGKGDMAVELAEQVFEVRKAKLGPEHVETLISLGALGASYRSAGKLDRALAAAEQRFKIEKEKGPEVSVTAMLELAQLYRVMGRLDQAVPLFEEGIKRLRTKDLEGFNALIFTTSLGWVYMGLGKPEQALPLFERTFRLSKAKLGPKHRDTIVAMEGVVLSQLKQGRVREAEELLDQTLSEVRGNPKATARVFGLRGEVHTDRSQLNEAVADFSEAIRMEPTAVRYSQRGEIRAKHGRFSEAATDFSEAIQMQPTDHQLYHSRAACLVQTGDVEAYRGHCRQIMSRFAQATDPYVADRMAKDCSILPASGVDLAALDRWTDRALAAGEAHRDFHWFLLAKGLAHYRHGRYASAAETMQKVLEKSGSVYERDVAAWMVLAMARHQLQKHDQANSALAQGLQLAETKLRKLESGDIGDLWVDWVFAHAFMREARSLIEQGNQSADRAINQQAKAQK